MSLGAGRTRALSDVTLRLIAPAIVVGAVLHFALPERGRRFQLSPTRRSRRFPSRSSPAPNRRRPSGDGDPRAARCLLRLAPAVAPPAADSMTAPARCQT